MTTSIAMPRPIATRTSPTTETAVGTSDQPKRWSKALKIITAGQQQEETGDENFLDGSPFRCRPSMHASLESCGVLQAQVNARDTGRDGKDGDKHPGLPVIEGPCWQEQQHP